MSQTYAKTDKLSLVAVPLRDGKMRYKPRHLGARGYSFPWSLPPSASAPASSKAASQKPNHKQKQDGANGSVDDRGDNASTEMDTDSCQQPVANECTDNAYDEIADESESGAPYDLSGQPASNKTDEQYDQKTFV